MDNVINLRTPSHTYNHGGYYAPSDPKTCEMPGGPCGYCEARIEEEEVARSLLDLKNSKACCSDRPEFIEPCPCCGARGTYITHESKGLRTCNGCEDKFCTKCYHGSRYCCAYVYPGLAAPASAERQLTLGVRSPKAEEKEENK